MGCDIHPYAEVFRDGAWSPVPISMPGDRNYRAFALLAGVRNGEGFAGCDTGDPLMPIALPRGLPEDTSIREDDDVEGVWLGDHSRSWVLLSELLALDLDAPATERGMVAPGVAKKLQTEGAVPDQWCGFTNREGWVDAEWQRPVRESAWLIPKLIEAMTPLGPPDKVRLVFGFDS